MHHNTSAHNIIECQKIGKDLSIGAFVHILKKASIGDHCTIGSHIFVDNNVSIGNNVTIHSGVQLWEGTTIEDDVTIGPNVTFVNQQFDSQKENTIIKKGARIGANATLLPGITIGTRSIIGAGAVVTKDIPSNAIVAGNPARLMGYVETAPYSPTHTSTHTPTTIPAKLRVRGASLLQMPLLNDIRGTLSFGEIEHHLPFAPKRYFLVYDVPKCKVRGEHAHRSLHQLLICIRGSCNVTVDDGNHREEVVLNAPHLGLHIPPLVWGIQHNYSNDAMLLVLASDQYNGDDYIRNYDEFLQLTRQQR